MVVSLSYVGTVPSSSTENCLILGELCNLKKITFDTVKPLIGHKVSEQLYTEVVESLSESDGASLYPKQVSIASLSSKRSRHTTPTGANYVMDAVNKHVPKSGDTLVVVVCQRRYVYPCGIAVARAFPTYTQKTKEVTSRAVQVCFVTPDDSTPLSEQDVGVLTSTANGIRLAAEIVDKPRNQMTCTDLVNLANKVADELPGVSVVLIRGEALKEGGFGGIYGVGQAALDPPALVVLSYKPETATKTIAWCGKGIMYDTGGFSIKTKTGMHGMKRDCGGAAGILAAFKATVECGFTENLHAVLCIAENSVGPKATVPDDVHILYSGKSVEINNTDAEGRLVLGDGVAYARKDLQADIVLDMATLTGAQGITTGRYHGAVLTNNEQWEKCAVEAGLNSGEQVFPIVYAPEHHFQEFKSSVADMKNSVAARDNAQCSCAGLFIGSHLLDDFFKPSNIVWIHVDMAYPVHVGERATGWGPALLMTLFGQYSKSSMLSALCPALPVDNVAKRPKHDMSC